MDQKRFVPGSECYAPAGRRPRWQIPPDQMERALALHRGGKNATFIYRVLWHDTVPPVSCETFSVALADLVSDLERLQAMRLVGDDSRGRDGEFIERAIRGETILPPDLEESRMALLESQRILLRRLKKEEFAMGEDGETGGDPKNLRNCADGIAGVSGRLIALQKYRLDTAILQTNLSPPKEVGPLAHSRPAVVLEMPKRTG